MSIIEWITTANPEIIYLVAEVSSLASYTNPEIINSFELQCRRYAAYIHVSYKHHIYVQMHVSVVGVCTILNKIFKLSVI